MSSTQDHDGEPALAPGAAEVLQAATRMLAGVALRSLDALDAAVTLPQFRLLAILADLGPVPSGQAARALGLDPSTVTRLADRMVAAGHVTRGTDPRHRGVVTLTLTPSGRDPGGARRTPGGGAKGTRAAHGPRSRPRNRKR